MFQGLEVSKVIGFFFLEFQGFNIGSLQDWGYEIFSKGFKVQVLRFLGIKNSGFGRF
jgi:hypothetical protein